MSYTLCHCAAVTANSLVGCRREIKCIGKLWLGCRPVAAGPIIHATTQPRGEAASKINRTCHPHCSVKAAWVILLATREVRYKQHTCRKKRKNQIWSATLGSPARVVTWTPSSPLLRTHMTTRVSMAQKRRGLEARQGKLYSPSNNVTNAKRFGPKGLALGNSMVFVPHHGSTMPNIFRPVMFANVVGSARSPAGYTYGVGIGRGNLDSKAHRSLFF